MILKRKDTPENRAFWKFVEDTAAYVRSHALCFTNHCVMLDSNCPKRREETR